MWPHKALHFFGEVKWTWPWSTTRYPHQEVFPISVNIYEGLRSNIFATLAISPCCQQTHMKSWNVFLGTYSLSMMSKQGERWTHFSKFHYHGSVCLYETAFKTNYFDEKRLRHKYFYNTEERALRCCHLPHFCRERERNSEKLIFIFDILSERLPSMCLCLFCRLLNLGSDFLTVQKCELWNAATHVCIE